jgi:hypothetical protein
MRNRTQRGLVVMLAGVVLMALACGGSAATRPRSTPAGGPLPAVVQQLQAPDSPYRIIYYPPVSLAKQPPAPAPDSGAARRGKPRH